ncbi:MAG: hypothetical protein KAW14_11285 [Candidatus Aegiribacteria sp.]|nr:hypothetical protein [Candidatus Aegiribacteria sp.]
MKRELFISCSLIAASVSVCSCNNNSSEGAQANFEILLYSDFEDYDFFPPPPPIENIIPLQWYLESDYADAVIDTTRSRSGSRSVKLVGSTTEGSAIACGIPYNQSYLIREKRLDAYFMIPQDLTEFTVVTFGIENFEEQDNVSAYIYITASGLLCYATGNLQNCFDLEYFDSIDLQPDEWYYVSLQADYVSRKYISFSIQGINIDNQYDISDKNLHYDISEIEPYIGVFYYLCYWCPDSIPSGHCWFDDATLFIGTNESNKQDFPSGLSPLASDR